MGKRYARTDSLRAKRLRWKGSSWLRRGNADGLAVSESGARSVYVARAVRLPAPKRLSLSGIHMSESDHQFFMLQPAW